MDLRTVLTISTLLLMTPGSDHANPVKGLETSTTTLNSSTTSNCPCPPAPTCPTTPTPTPCPTYRPPAPAISFLTISWKDCEGNIKLKNASSSSSAHVCHDSLPVVKRLLGNVCANKKGCEGESVWSNHRDMDGYSIKEGGEMEEKGNCITLKVQCTVDGQRQLQAYKVVIALLCCVLIVLLLIRFTRPTVKALQKRLSDRRQSRWIGPTQSHSVSYHRGKTAVKNNDGEKRLSYPALERLTVSNSREPSSNRNSDCNY